MYWQLFGGCLFHYDRSMVLSPMSAKQCFFTVWMTRRPTTTSLLDCILQLPIHLPLLLLSMSNQTSQWFPPSQTISKSAVLIMHLLHPFYSKTADRAADYVSSTPAKCRSVAPVNPTDEPIHFSANDFTPTILNSWLDEQYSQDNSIPYTKETTHRIFDLRERTCFSSSWFPREYRVCFVSVLGSSPHSLPVFVVCLCFHVILPFRRHSITSGL
jgi:hypothetical protein